MAMMKPMPMATPKAKAKPAKPMKRKAKAGQAPAAPKRHKLAMPYRFV